MTVAPRKPAWNVEREQFHCDGWAVEVATTIGLRRQRQEDSWHVGFDSPLAGRRADVFAVFDGLGGEANGDKASRAAADGLEAAMKATPGADSLLRQLNRAVIDSRGATTAVVFMAVRGGSTFLATVGDSSAYGLVRGKAELLAPHDEDPHTGGMSDQLGLYFRQGRLTNVSLETGEAVLLCTDGVDGALDPAAIVKLLGASRGIMSEAVDHAMAKIREAGAPDNATLVLVRRAGV